MKKTSVIILFFVFTLGLCAQEFTVPKDYKLEKAEDYAVYQEDVLKGINWILDTPINEKGAQRTEINAFVLKWLMGSPTVHIDIKPEIVTFISSSPDLLMIFLSGWAKYSLETNDSNNKAAGSLAGLEAVIDFYTKNNLPKDKNIEKFIKMKQKGKLKEYVEKNA